RAPVVREPAGPARGMAGGAARGARALSSVELPDRDLLGPRSASALQRGVAAVRRRQAPVGARTDRGRSLARHLARDRAATRPSDDARQGPLAFRSDAADAPGR